jgi:hypothetical protein
VGIVFDEAVGINAAFWEAAMGMMTGPSSWFLAICNPTDTSSRFYEEEVRGGWEVVTISALDHPNIAAELRGEDAPIPNAVRLQWVEQAVREWCTPIAAADKRPGDVEWRPGTDNWFRPGPLFEGRVLGRWPTAGSTAVWTEAVWKAALTQQSIPDAPLEIGCDVARFGDDYTSMVVRRGACALHHETHNGWSTSETAGRLKQLSTEYAEGEDPRGVVIKIDDDGVGGGVVDQADGWRFEGMSAGARAIEPGGYPNRRSEAWFAVALLASDGALDLSRLCADSLSLLRRQAMAPTWKLDSAGRRVVEQKADTKKRLGRSPDDMDALNLAFAPSVMEVERGPAILV